MRDHFAQLIAEGHLQLGDELFHPLQRQTGGELTARVVQGGLEVDGVRYSNLSSAAKAAAGYAANGWLFWRRRSTGRTLDDLRKASTT